MKHSCLINGYDTLNLTKLDILDDLKEIKIAVNYMLNEEELPGFPGEPTFYGCPTNADLTLGLADLGVLDKVEVVYVTLPGWQSSIASTTSFGDLPENCQKYIGFIERFLNVPIEWVGVGPGRESMIKKERKIAVE